jgi:hypothetical protein
MKFRSLLSAAIFLACGPSAEPESIRESRTTIQSEPVVEEEKVLHTDPAVESSPDLPGTGFVVWESNRSGSWRIWYREMASGEPRQLSPDEGRRIHCCPHISPDGESIVYLSLPPDQKLYPKGGAVGRMDWIRPDGTDHKTLLDSARNYYENRAAVWRSPNELIYIEADGRSALLDLDSGDTRRLTNDPNPELPWLLNPPLAWAASGIGGFGEFDRQTGRVARRNSLPGCQPYFSHDGRWVFWVQSPGGPLAFTDLASGMTGTLLKKSDPRLPRDRGYLYFPMLSADGRMLALGASPDEFDHFESDYDILVMETDPETLEILGEPIRITDHPATDRFPDVWVAPLPLGRHQGEAPFRVQLQPPGSDQVWQWHLGDGNTTEGASIEHSYERPGRYTVEAKTGQETRRGRIVVHPAAPPQVVSTSLRQGGREILVAFDEEIDIARSTALLSSGIEIQDSRLGAQNRRLHLRVAESIESADQLTLTGVRDRAQQPNEAGIVQVPIEPPFWPSSREGLALVFQTANAPNLVHDADLAADTAVQLEPRGLARLDPSFALLPSGGFFAASDRDSARVVGSGKATNELTIEMVLEPFGRHRGKSGVILASGSARRINFRLEQRGSRLVFTARKQRSKSDAPGEVALFPLPVGKTSHITITFTPGQLHAYLDGEEVSAESSLQKGFHHWRPGPLTLGANAEGANSWRGRAEGLTIYNRILDAEEVRENFQRYQRILDSRPPIDSWRILATRTECSAVPTLEEIQPYREALSVCTFELRDLVEGERLDTSLRIALLSVLDGQRLDLTAPSATEELVLTRFRDNPQLESLYLSDSFEKTARSDLFYASIP